MRVGSNAVSLTTINLEPDEASLDLDIVVIADGGGVVLRNDLNGGTQLTFADAEALDIGANPILITTADLDMDGQDDLVW